MLSKNNDASNKRNLLNGLDRLYGVYTDFFNRHNKAPNKAGGAGRKGADFSTKDRNIYQTRIEDLNIYIGTHIGSVHLKTPSDVVKDANLGVVTLVDKEGKSSPYPVMMRLGAAEKSKLDAAPATRKDKPMIKAPDFASPEAQATADIRNAVKNEKMAAFDKKQYDALRAQDYHNKPVIDQLTSDRSGAPEEYDGPTTLSTEDFVYQFITFDEYKKQFIFIVNPEATLQHLIDSFAASSTTSQMLYYYIEELWDGMGL
jgi:hypothetical protein